MESFWQGLTFSHLLYPDTHLLRSVTCRSGTARATDKWYEGRWLPTAFWARFWLNKVITCSALKHIPHFSKVFSNIFFLNGGKIWTRKISLLRTATYHCQQPLLFARALAASYNLAINCSHIALQRGHKGGHFLIKKNWMEPFHPDL